MINRPSRRQCQSAFTDELPGNLGGGAENNVVSRKNHPPVARAMEVFHEVGHQPRLDAFHLAGQDRFLDLAERGLADVEDHAADGETVQQHGELGEKVAVGIQPGGDAQAPLGMFLE